MGNLSDLKVFGIVSAIQLLRPVLRDGRPGWCRASAEVAPVALPTRPQPHTVTV